jgi:hypothetical protein
MRTAFIPDTNQRYLIYEDGRIFDIKRSVFKKQFFMQYKRVRIGKNVCLVHRILAICFIDNPLNKREVNHKDGDKSNNNLSNLEWVTTSENLLHAYNTGLLKSKMVVNSNTGQIYKSAKEASECTGINYTTLTMKLEGSRTNNTTLKYL